MIRLANRPHLPPPEVPNRGEVAIQTLQQIAHTSFDRNAVEMARRTLVLLGEADPEPDATAAAVCAKWAAFAAFRGIRTDMRRVPA